MDINNCDKRVTRVLYEVGGFLGGILRVEWE